MAKECENCANKSDFKAPACGTCMVSYYDGEQLGLPSNFKPKPKTNADRIRAMSDEELAKFIREPFCDKRTYDECKISYCGVCEVCVMDWLKQPAEEVQQ